MQLTHRMVWFARFSAFALLLLLSGCGPRRGQAQKETEYKLFTGEQKVTLQGYAGDAMEPFLTKDGRFLLFNNRNEAPENTNLQYAERVDDLHFVYKGEIKGVNTPALEGCRAWTRWATCILFPRVITSIRCRRFTGGALPMAW